MLISSGQTDFQGESAESSSHDPANDSAEPTKESERQLLFAECDGRLGLTALIEVPGQRVSTQVPLDRPFIVVGADPDCEAQIVAKGIFGRHAYLQWLDGNLWGCALNSSNPTDQTGRWIGPDPVEIGGLRISVPHLQFNDDVQPIDEAQSRIEALASEIPQVQLKFVGVEQQDNIWPVDRRITLIGRSKLCRLRLDHPEVAPVMGAIIRTAIGCWIVDLCRNQKLTVNKLSHRFTAIDVGDVVQFGPFSAEICTGPLRNKARGAKATSSPKGKSDDATKLASLHRERAKKLMDSLDELSEMIDSCDADGSPELKEAIERVIAGFKDHQQKTQKALDRLSDKK